MTNNITVTEVINVFYQKTDKWERNFSFVRNFDAAVLFTEGEIEYNFQNVTVTAKKGDLLFLPGNIAYSGKKHTKNVGFYVIDFKCLTDGEFEMFGAPFTVAAKEYDSLLSGFKNALELWNVQQAKTQVYLKAFLYFLFTIPESYGNPAGKTQTGEILSWISNNFSDSTLTVKKLCDKFFISESQLRRNIHKATGLSPNGYITTLRINKAKSELLDSEKSIKSISCECGFSSAYYFSKCFSKHVGMSPVKYRTGM